MKNFRLLTLKREFEHFKSDGYKVGQRLFRHAYRYFNQIRLFGEPFPGHKIVEKVMGQKFLQLKSHDLITLSITKLTHKLHAQEHKDTLMSVVVFDGAFHIS